MDQKVSYFKNLFWSFGKVSNFKSRVKFQKIVEDQNNNFYLKFREEHFYIILLLSFVMLNSKTRKQFLKISLK